VTPDALFPVLNLVALVAWLAMILLPGARWSARLVPAAAAALLAAAYVALLAVGLPRAEGGGFSSLAAVRALFAEPWALLAGWTHYLAFDLLVGWWELRDARRRGVPHLLVVPALALTFLFGPGGWLLYLLIRRARRSSAATTMTSSSAAG
jgi:hypothetical protein